MKGIIIVLVIFFSTPLFGYVTDNALMPNPLPISEAARINLLNDLPVKIIQFDLLADSTERNSVYLLEYQFDEERLVSHTIRNEENQERYFRFDYIYEENRLEIRKSTPEDPLVEMHCFFFENNRLSVKERYRNNGELGSRYYFSYDEMGNLSLIMYDSPRTGEKKVYLDISYLNNRIRSMISRFDILYNFNYMENEVIIEHTNRTHRYSLEYDILGRLIRETYYTPTGQYLYFDEYFTYDEEGRLKTYQYFQYNDPDKIYEVGGNYMQEFYYDDSIPRRSELFDPRDLSDWEPSESEQDISSDQTIIENGETSEEVESDTNEGLSIVLYIGIAVLLLGVGLVVFFYSTKEVK